MGGRARRWCREVEQAPPHSSRSCTGGMPAAMPALVLEAPDHLVQIARIDVLPRAVGEPQLPSQRRSERRLTAPNRVAVPIPGQLLAAP